jgi:hypothetical protein
VVVRVLADPGGFVDDVVHRGNLFHPSGVG